MNRNIHTDAWLVSFKTIEATLAINVTNHPAGANDATCMCLASW